MTPTRTVLAGGPEDLLALVPALLGFHPEHSLVVMTVGHADNRFHARVDLPTEPEEREELAGYLAGVAVRNGVRAVALLVYSDDPEPAGVLVAALAARLEEASLHVVCAIRADGRRWWWLGPRGEGGPGTAYDVGSHPLMAEAVVEGTVVLASRQELADSLVGTDAADARLVAALARETVRRLAAGSDPAVERRWVRHRVRRFAEDGLRMDPHDVARLGVLVAASVEIRDVAWREMTRANAPRHVDLWRDVVRRVPRHLCAAPAALLGFAAWLAGNGALAWCAVDVAEEAEPGYPLAVLLATTLAGAVPPAVWHP
jgi:Domain of unknown function (DUF4192)